ncbi:PhoH family protein [Sinomonas flava]|uniref:PhoH family protein n=1 Tax=Sinomonas flava TaxID=496857 RepID=UPI003CD06411
MGATGGTRAARRRVDARVRPGRGERRPVTADFPHTTPAARTEVLRFGSSEEMVQILGPHDEALRFIEEQFPAVSFHARGNELTIVGPPEEVPHIRRLFEEVSAMAGQGTAVTTASLAQLVSMLRTQTVSSPSEVLTHNILSSRGRTIRPKTANQKNYVDAIDAHTVIFGIGPAGTGKTYLAMAKAVQALQHKDVSRIILTRPAVEAGERLGFLPGTLSDKIDPYLRPLYDALHDMMDPESIPRLMAAGTIEVAPLAYMRGRTLNDAFIILDEAQNTTPEQMKMFLTRLGFGSKMVVTGDVTQVDLPSGTASGLRVVQQILAGVEDVSFSVLEASDVVRHRLVSDIVDAYGRWDDEQRAAQERRRARARTQAPDGPTPTKLDQ